MSTTNDEWLKIQFFRFGMQYYVSGRYAVAARLVPVAGNHFHHAIEMFIKGAMVDGTNEKARRAWGHHLDKVWIEFKARHSTAQLSRFDSVVSQLDLFEDIRYPEP